MSKCMLILAGALLGGTAVAADSTPLAQCAAVDDPNARLACYDALAGRPGSAAVAAPAAPVAAPEVETFGRDATTSLTAHIVGKFTEWKYGTVFKLSNGQVWKSVDERASIYPALPENPEVVITKGMLGYRMEIIAIGRRIAVRRVS